MLKQGRGGAIVNMSSVAGFIGGHGVATYSASKHGVLGLVKSLALEVATRPVTVNAICPGYLATQMTERTIETIARKTGRSPEQARRTLASQNSHGRLVEPCEVTAVALRLCGEGSESVNGQAIAVPEAWP